MAASAANRVEVPVLGFVDLLAEAGVGGVLATGASLAISPSGHLGELGLGSGEGGGHVIELGCTVGLVRFRLWGSENCRW